MKRILAILFTVIVMTFSQASMGKNYYFSTSIGDDSRPEAQAQNPQTPWKTLHKLNTISENLKPGDSVLFKRGDVFNGYILLKSIGKPGSSIVFSAYGIGANPVISGFFRLNFWEPIGGGIYKSHCSGCKSTVNILSINNNLQAMGRWPNTGYLTYESHENSSITDKQLTGGPNWSGAELVIRMNRWVINKSIINSQSGGTLTFNPEKGRPDPTDGFGYFIQNGLKTLDTFGEWHLDPLTNDMEVFFGSNDPDQFNVNTSIIDTLVYIEDCNNITFENLLFQGANKSAFQITGSPNIHIQDCNIVSSGADAIDGSSSPFMKIENSTINQSLNKAINLDYICTNSIIKGNKIKNTGLFPGMGQNGTGTYEAITSFGDDCLIEFNKIDSTGYNGIYFGGNSTVVKNNCINYFCLTKDDGGGIYVGDWAPWIHKEITENIILNGEGNGDGTKDTQIRYAEGIYIDEGSANVNISLNTVAGCANSGIKIHNVQDIEIKDNTLFNNENQVIIAHDNSSPSHKVQRVEVKNNTFFSKKDQQLCFYLYSTGDILNISNIGTVNYNYYFHPIIDTDNVVRAIAYAWSPNSIQTNSFSQWKETYNYDVDSKIHLFNADSSRILFRYNATRSQKKISLNGTYVGVDGAHYSNSVTLLPFTSIILIKIEGNNEPPTASVKKKNIEITLPERTIILDGNTSTDPDGKIVSYQWEQLSGPSMADILDEKAAQTQVTGLQQGNYLFQLTVTDKDGTTATASVRVTVHPAPNIVPMAQVKKDKIILTLPENTATLDGRPSNDPDGKIVSYLWEQLSGPATATFADENAAQTEVSDLKEGVYRFQLKVTDDDDATATTKVQVKVNPKPNQAPEAITEEDNITITLPENTATLDGRPSNDPDGKIVSWKWEQLSGPATATFADENAAQTKVSDLKEGIYSFQLKVTDDNDATATSKVQVKVNPKPNQAPEAITEEDNITITLPENTATLDGRPSNDPDGKIVSYQWEQLAGPSMADILDKKAAQTQVTGLQQGNYLFQLTVTDQDGATSTASVQVTVHPAPNKVPMAKVKENELAITLPKSSVTLDGSGSTDFDGKIVSYQWKQRSGPSAAEIVDKTSSKTKVIDLKEGKYLFDLTVTDNEEATSMASVQVTVHPAPNKAPTAKVKENELTITLPKSSVTLDGSGSTDSDGKIVSYQWKQQSGPSAAEIVDKTSSKTKVIGLKKGDYLFQLTVTDKDGATATARVAVTVHPLQFILIKDVNYTILSGGNGYHPYRIDTTLPALNLDSGLVRQTFALYPNPASNYLNVRFYTDQMGKVAFIIYNAVGVVVQKQYFNKNKKYFSKKLNISHLTEGVYFVQVRMDHYTSVKKLLKIQ